MSKRRNNANNGWHPQDDDRYVDNRYIHETEYDDNEDDYEYEDYEVRPRRARQSPQRSRPVHTEDEYTTTSSRTSRQPSSAPRRPRQVQRVKPRRKRRAWGTFVLGCFIGIFLVVGAIAILVLLGITSLQTGGNLTNLPAALMTRTYTQSASQQISLSQLSQLTICDQVGNISVKVDPAASQATVATQKTVQSTSQANANKLFQQETVETQPPTTITQPLTCTQKPSTNTTTSSSSALTINVTIPQPASSKVDLTVTIPASAIQSNSPSLQLNIGAQQGNVEVNGLSGVLKVSNTSGNIDVQHAILAYGSQLQTNEGNVSFNGFLFMPASDTQANARFLMNSETGDIHVTLPATTNLTLDANTNIGTINSNFPISVNNSGGTNKGPANYHGPLDNNSTTNLSPATLVLDVSTGNVYITKAQTPTAS
jgi:hypothetical protein